MYVLEKSLNFLHFECGGLGTDSKIHCTIRKEVVSWMYNHAPSGWSLKSPWRMVAFFFVWTVVKTNLSSWLSYFCLIVELLDQPDVNYNQQTKWVKVMCLLFVCLFVWKLTRGHYHLTCKWAARPNNIQPMTYKPWVNLILKTFTSVIYKWSHHFRVQKLNHYTCKLCL